MKSIFAVSILVLAATAFGCSKEQRDQIAEKVNQTTEQVSSKAKEVSKQATESVSQAKEQVVSDGESQLRLDKDLFFGSTFVNLITVKGRGSVLQLRSYSDPSSESIPSYFFQANTTSSTLNSLSGQSVSGTLFVKRDKSEATWMSLEDQPVTIVLESIVDAKLKGRFSAGKLSTAGGDSIGVSGTFEAVAEGGLE